jgi:hypothetical protein
MLEQKFLDVRLAPSGARNGLGDDGVMTTSGRSAPLPWLVVKVICQLLKRCTESAI